MRAGRRRSGRSAGEQRSSVSSVTALATRRPPGRSAAKPPRSGPARVAPPPMNTASGAGSPARLPGAWPTDDAQVRHAEAAALRAMRAARSASASTAMARLAGWRSIHSMATEPAPAPTSHSSSPAPGRQGGRVTARISRLGELPVVLEPGVVETGRQGTIRASRPAATSTATTLRGSIPGEVEALGPRRADMLPRAAHGLEHGQAEPPKPRSREEVRRPGRGWSRPRTGRGSRAPGWRCGIDALQGAAVQADAGAFRQGPAEPGRREAECGRVGEAHRSRRRERAGRARRRRRIERGPRRPARRPAARAGTGSSG